MHLSFQFQDDCHAVRMAQIRVGKLLLHTGLATAQCLNQKALLICLRIALQL